MNRGNLYFYRMGRIGISFLFSLFSLAVSAQKKSYPPIPQDEQLSKGKESFLAEGSVAGRRPAKRPNVILIVADDLGRYDLSVYGNSFIQTPNIDSLAKSGALFTDGYATAAVCSPSRAGMLTGRYQQRFGYHVQPHQRYPKNRLEWWFFKHLVKTGYLEPALFQAFPAKTELPKAGLPTSELALSELLKKSGYATAWIGKWHLGYEEPLLPRNFGFDYRYGCLEAYTLFADPKDLDVVNARINEFTDKVIWKGARKGYCAIRENEQEVDEKEYITYAFARRAKQFITNHKSEPFFIYLPVTAPHTPYQAPKDIYDRLGHIADHNKRVYYAMILALDKAVGDIINHLREEGLYEKTMIIFTSDNGAALYSETVDNKPLAGGKMTFFEGGINVPLIMHYPGVIKPRTVMAHPINLCDIFPTVAALANAPLPADREYDGVSLLPWLTGARKDAPHEALFWWADYNMAVRLGSLKLHVNTMDKTVDLYDLSVDRGESRNLYPEQKVTADALLAAFETWRKNFPPMRWPRIMDYRLTINGKVYRWAI
jgi:arylsulfatase A-like enzyme